MLPYWKHWIEMMSNHLQLGNKIQILCYNLIHAFVLLISRESQSIQGDCDREWMVGLWLGLQNSEHMGNKQLSNYTSPNPKNSMFQIQVN